MRIRPWAWIAFATACVIATVIGLLAGPADNLALVRERYHPEITSRPNGAVLYVFPVTVSENDVRRDLSVAPGYVIKLDSDCLEVFQLPNGRWAEMQYDRGGGCCQLEIHSDKRPWFQREWTALVHRFRP
ncbi:MAG: hypothetical protein ACHQ50_01735 [Fimbriimonadales bacterium]